jgi:hypothetical protein
MPDFDVFASTLLEEAKRFVERAVAARGGSGEAPNLHAGLMLAFCALEAHVNAVADEMAQRGGQPPHVMGVLLEKEVRLVDGRFELDNRLRISRLEDRVYLLHAYFGLKPDLHGPWRAALAGALGLRNKLTHPKGVPTITVDAVKGAVQAVIDTIDSLYRALYDRPFPVATRELASKLDF